MTDSNNHRNFSGYRVLPCVNGVCLIDSDFTRERVISDGVANANDLKLLPGNMLDDYVYDPIGDGLLSESIFLDNIDVKNLSCDVADNFSFTYYGPDGQDKSTNQDFALSGAFQGDNDASNGRFTILADGISNGFAFAQRGAQVSVFASYYALKQFWDDTISQMDGNRPITANDVDGFRLSLADQINNFLHEDRQLVLQTEEIPSSVSETVWHSHFLNQPSRWYGNTLILTFMSSFGGFIIYAGDGAILFRKSSEQNEKEVLRSTDDPTVDRFVSYDVKPEIFQKAVIESSPNVGYYEIITATDGLDRTIARNEVNFFEWFSEGRSLDNIVQNIIEIENNFDNVDIDNYSIGRILYSNLGVIDGRLTDSYQLETPNLSRPPRKKLAPTSTSLKRSPKKTDALASKSDHRVKKKSRWRTTFILGLLTGVAMTLLTEWVIANTNVLNLIREATAPNAEKIHQPIPAAQKATPSENGESSEATSSTTQPPQPEIKASPKTVTPKIIPKNPRTGDTPP